MIKIIKYLIIVLLLLILGFFVWMNVTPGHFNTECCSPVVYSQKLTDITGKTYYCPMVVCQEKSWFENFLLLLSEADFNK